MVLTWRLVCRRRSTISADDIVGDAGGVVVVVGAVAVDHDNDVDFDSDTADDHREIRSWSAVSCDGDPASPLFFWRPPPCSRYYSGLGPSSPAKTRPSSTRWTSSSDDSRPGDSRTDRRSDDPPASAAETAAAGAEIHGAGWSRVVVVAGAGNDAVVEGDWPGMMAADDARRQERRRSERTMNRRSGVRVTSVRSYCRRWYRCWCC